MAKVQISIDDELLQRIDSFADSNYMSRSGFFTLASCQYLNSNEMMLAIKDMSLTMRKIADSGSIDEESERKLEDYERMAKMIVGK